MGFFSPIKGNIFESCFNLNTGLLISTNPDKNNKYLIIVGIDRWDMNINQFDKFLILKLTEREIRAIYKNRFHSDGKPFESIDNLFFKCLGSSIIERQEFIFGLGINQDYKLWLSSDKIEQFIKKCEMINHQKKTEDELPF